ncbi:putative ribonuclease H-like domain-containing protein [Tanacetum coccineum]
MNYVPVVVAGTSSTNISGTKEDALKENVSSLRYIALPNWFYEAQMETSNDSSRNRDAFSEKDHSETSGACSILKQLETESSHVVTPVFPLSVLSIHQDFFGDTLILKQGQGGGSRTYQEEGIDSEEVFALLQGLRLLVILRHMLLYGFTIYQMNVKSAFLYGTIDKEVVKAMYGLHQAPRAWYGTLSKYLLDNGFQRDDIIFGSSNPKLCREFEALMHDKFKMSAMGELNFFLGLQVLQKKDGIFLSQDKYVVDILKKFGYTDIKLENTPMDRENPWGKDGTGKDVELHLYRSMIKLLDLALNKVDHDHDNMKYPSTPTLDSAHPKLTSFVKTAHSHVKRPFVRKTAVKNKVWVPTARTKFPTVGSKVPTAKPTVAAVKGNRGKAVKASACWIWKPKQNQPDQGSNLNGVSGIPQDNIDDKGYWDSGCSRHMTGNISYLSEYEPYNGGYVSFGHGGGMITGKGTIKTGKLEFENVYFVKELKYNLFSVSQICDNKNSVLFTDSECLGLG